MFSKACEYAIRATIFIAHRSADGQRTGLKDIAQAIDSPEAFTAKILQSLSRNGVISSVKGPMGGFVIRPESIQQVRLSDIVNAIDGPDVYKRCAIGLSNCSESTPCPLHQRFKSVREDLKSMLENTRLAELSDKINMGGVHLRI